MDEPIKCPKCGSTQITANKKGFSGTKAAAGVIIAGGIGLAAGGIGSNKIIITCLKCGHQFKPGSEISKPQGPMTIGGFIFMLCIATGVLIPACGGSWWFLLIMPILGFISIIFNESNKDNKSKTLQSSTNYQETLEPKFNSSVIGKQKIICSKCNGTNEIHFKYCRICGGMLDIDKMNIINDKSSFEYEKCSNCNKLTPKKSNKCQFCTNCGFELQARERSSYKV